MIEPIVISFYATCDDDVDKYFEAQAKALEDECRHWGMRHCIEERPNRGTWRANSHYKPEYIGEMLGRFQSAVLWIDVDLGLHVRPVLPWDCGACDWIGYHYRAKECVDNEKFERNGTRDCLHFVNYTQQSLDCIHRWIHHCTLHPLSGDHAGWGPAYHESVAAGLDHKNMWDYLPVFVERKIDVAHPPREIE